MTGHKGVAILGIFVADLAFRAGRLPGIGETIAGSGFKMGPGGKGSNQAVAAARVGAPVTFISKIGRDEFGANALATWKKERITPRVVEMDDQPTGAAFIYVNDKNGDNAIIVVAGAAGTINVQDVENAADAIRNAAVFITQLEQPVAAAKRGLEIAKAQNVPPYVIFHDKTLLEMAARQPRTLMELASVPGTGTVKLARYGEAFLEVINAHGRS